MFQKLGRLFVIKTKWEAYFVIYALAVGAMERGSVYLEQYPGFAGKLLFLACTGSVFMAGAKILDCLRHEKAAREGRNLLPSSSCGNMSSGGDDSLRHEIASTTSAPIPLTKPATADLSADRRSTGHPANSDGSKVG